LFGLILSALALVAMGCARGSQEKVFVLGVDGITFDLLLPWARQGRLPNFARIMETGSSTQLISVVPPFSPPAWTSATTGVNPGKHGIFGYVREITYGRGEPQLHYYTASDRISDPLWVLLTERGRRSVVVNVPCTAPPDSFDGIMICGFPQTSPTHFTYPADYRLKIPEYRVDHFGQMVFPETEGEFLMDLDDVMDRRTEVILKLLDEERWDLFFAVLTIADRVQHNFWKYMDPQHPLWTPEKAALHGDAIFKAYQRVDSFLGRLRQKLSPQTTLIIMSDHGFGPVHQIVNSPNWLSAAMPRAISKLWPRIIWGELLLARQEEYPE
jgi:predicted AlkP superfamily phosphohydrolase/phosphomutase